MITSTISVTIMIVSIKNMLSCPRIRDSSYDNETIFFDYDRNYKESVDEIIAKFTSDNYAEQRREIAEHKDNDCLYFLPDVAKLLRMTEGTLRRRPLDIQLAVCKRYVDNWYCDTYTIQHELKDAMMLITKPET